jgi:ribosomal protein S18 acetylase RimI-like enzyme
MFEIERTWNAKSLVDFCEVNGLPNIRLWTNTEGIQETLLDEDGFAYIAKIPHEKEKQFIIGVILGYFEEEGRIWFEMLAVSEKFRKKGIGKALINRVCEIGTSKNFRACFVDVDISNSGGIIFYKKCGFEQVGNINHYYYDDTDALIFMKRI